MAKDARVALQVLGGFKLETPEKTITQFSYDKVKALFMLLLLSEKAVSRSLIASWLWPDTEASSARTNLRHALHSLRQALGKEETVLEISRQNLALNASSSSEWSIDLMALTACLDGEPNVDNLECILTLYRGELAEGLQLNNCGEFQRWLLERREQCRLSVIHYIERVFKATSNVDAHLVDRIVHLFPRYDVFQRRAISNRIEQGDIEAAREHYNAYLEQLAISGQQPSPELLKLARAWSSDDEGAADHAFRAPASVPSDGPMATGLQQDDIDYRQISVMVIRISHAARADAERQWMIHCLDAQRQLIRWVEQQCRHLGGFWLPGAAGGLGMACFGTHGPAHQLAELVALYEHCRRSMADVVAASWQGSSSELPQFDLAAGLHSGRAIFIPERRMMDPFGAVTQPALELVSTARGSELVISPEASHQMPPALDLQPRLFMRLWAANGEVRRKMLVLSSDHSAEPLPPHLFGREVAERELEDALSRAMIGLRQSVLVRGESGMGKSALMVHFRQLKQSSDIDVCWVSNTRVSYQEPFGLLRTLFRWRLGGALTREALDRIRSVHPEAASWSEEGVGLLYRLLGVDGSPGIEPDSAQQRRAIEIATIALQYMIENRCQHRPLLIMLDDLQWIDEASLKILANTQARLAMHHPLLIVASLPMNSPLQACLHWDRQVVLGRLDANNTARLLEYLARRYRLNLGSRVRQQLLERCDGVPLYLQEICRRLYMERRDGRPVEIERLPSGLVGLLSSRIDQLDEFRSEAHVASVIGRQFSSDLLQKCLDITDRRLKQALERMRRMEIIERCVNSNEFDYQFSHQLLHEAAYSGCHPDIRKRNHAFLVELIERERPHWLSRYPGYFAHHLCRCGIFARAARYFELAARDAVQAGASHTALAMADDGLDCIEQTADVVDRHISLLIVRGHAGFELEGSMSSIAEQSFSKAQALLEAKETVTSGDEEVDDQYFTVLWGQLIIMNERLMLDEAQARARLLIECAKGMSDERYTRLAELGRGSTAFFRGNIIEATQAFEAMGEMSQGLSLEWVPYALHPQIQSGVLLACCASLRADYEHAEFCMDALMSRATDLKHPPSQVMALVGSGCLYRRHGHVRLVAERADKALAITSTADLDPWRWAAECLRGWVDAVMGKPEGVIRLEEALEALSERAFGNLYCMAVVWYIEACQALGYLQRAVKVFERNIEFYRRSDLLYLPELLIVHARSLAKLGERQDEVRTLLTEAIELARANCNLHFELVAQDAWLTYVKNDDDEVIGRLERTLLTIPASDAPLMMRFRQRLNQLNGEG
ncbi:AAA family ATPase [Larsenimonas suaedae]|uniref:AAA family ATPase n=1 Tax=Larsenimonas suaedae TaxID=1851019 RepID=A0ABU1GT69_9GAMM|nr:AAA family ATPase [Larsenimonas suaedae]MCM2971674.1 AAA family ATPase [Larsenimonas suaedae]MDR5895226.1 AAA family ATPase [Larsenimonas suaedae]